MFRFIKNMRTFLKYLTEFGLKFTLKYALSYLGIRTYSTIKYPSVGIKVTVRPHSFWKRLQRGRWEFKCIKYISNVVGKGQTILDVGAWIGPYTLLFSKLMQDTGCVYAFDPDPKAFDILRENVEKNALTNVRIEKICMSNSVGKAQLGASQFGKSGSLLIEREKRTALSKIIVETTTIDKFCEENGICPDGIKIDVEGAEALVIDGCRNIIDKYSPWILLEFHGSYMSEKERKLNWHKIVDPAKKVIFINGNSNQYRHGSKVHSIPDSLYFHIFIQY